MAMSLKRMSSGKSIEASEEGSCLRCWRLWLRSKRCARCRGKNLRAAEQISESNVLVRRVLIVVVVHRRKRDEWRAQDVGEDVARSAAAHRRAHDRCTESRRCQ